MKVTTKCKGLTSNQRYRYLVVGCLFVTSIIFNIPHSIRISSDAYLYPPTTATLPNIQSNNLSNTVDQDTKFILFYTKYWNQPDFQFGTGRQPFLDYQCPIHNCWVHSASTESPALQQRRNYSDFDAVLFSVQAQDQFQANESNPDTTSIRSWRRPHQRFVFFIMESQAYSIHNLRSMNGFFNWTMTFRWDTDIPRPYGWFEELSHTTSSSSSSSFYPHPPKQWIPYDEQQFRQTLSTRPKQFLDLARRPGKVAWIVSHCDTSSRREDYVHQLRKYIPVDEFGGKCRRHSSPTCDQPYSIQSTALDNCTRHVQQHYKFYLAFENQFCNDYVTEKFFQRMEHSVVITLGQANYTRLAPPHSSISVFDFDTAQDLANYLHQLDQDDASYLSYFWWQDYYRVRHSRLSLKETSSTATTTVTTTSSTNLNGFGRSMCHLCEKLHDSKEPPKVYHNLYQWWRESAECGKRLHSLNARMWQDPALPGLRTMHNAMAHDRIMARGFHRQQQQQQQQSPMTNATHSVRNQAPPVNTSSR